MDASARPHPPQASSEAESPDRRSLAEAAEWFVRMQAGQLTADEQGQWHQWRKASSANEAAWRRVESLQDRFAKAASPVSVVTLSRSPRSPRRRNAILGLLATAAVAAAFGIRWRTEPTVLLAESATGEQRRMTLVDGTRMTLNTNSSVRIVFDDEFRTVTVERGEILIETAHDPSPHYRPFRVTTVDGTATALGTRFTVRRLPTASRVGVIEGRVEVRPERLAGSRILSAGEATTFDATGIDAVQALDGNTAAWTRGLLIVDDLPLAAFVDEISRYRTAAVRCAPDVERLRISGAFPLDDTNRVLDSLADTMPVIVTRAADGSTAISARPPATAKAPSTTLPAPE